MSYSYDNDWVIVTLTADGSTVKSSYYNVDDNYYYNNTRTHAGLSNAEIALGQWQCSCWETYNYRAWWDYISVRNYDSTTYTIQIENHRMHSVLAVNYGLLMRSFTLLLGNQFCLKYLYIDIK